MVPATPSTRLEKLSAILEVAKAMATAPGLDALLDIIVASAARVVGADRCSIFLLDVDAQELWTRVAQGATSDIRVPLGVGLVGHVAKSGKALRLSDAYSDPRFARSADAQLGYRTQSLLCVPMLDGRGELTGVLEAVNKFEGQFSDEDEELLTALGGQAAATLESALLRDEIAQLFESFVSASVLAVESRDPTTAGHSHRVAALTVELARNLERGNLREGAEPVRFEPSALRELRYAALLHDFGKVAIREHVLVKANKLYPDQLEKLRLRFELFRRDLQISSDRRRLDAVLRRGPAALAAVAEEEDAQLEIENAKLDAALELIAQSNRPTVLPEGSFEALKGLSAYETRTWNGERLVLLPDEERELLSIRKGSLSEAERTQLESHVQTTFQFLSRIPWTKDLRRVPELAYSHHERMNGKGYPRKLAGSDIPLGSRIMAVCDVYDALTASDRPYKKAVPHARALDILWEEAKAELLDAKLLQVFVEADVSRLVREK